MTSVQDQGRPSMAALALSRGGAADLDAAATANRLVGNGPADAVLEITGPGPRLEIPCDLWLASFGARHALLAEAIAGRPLHNPIALPLHRPLFVPAASILRWDAPSAGWRSWIAFAGGLQGEVVLGSRSAHLAAGIGAGMLGAASRIALSHDAEHLSRRRALGVLGDRAFSRAHQFGEAAWPRWQLADPLPLGWPRMDIPVLAGRHWNLLDEASRGQLLAQEWTVSPQSNRQGLRLDVVAGSGKAIAASGLANLASEAVGLGTVQLPPAGCPVILLAEHQTTGGYPRVLEVASAGCGLLAQACGRCRIRFQRISLAQADQMSEDLALRRQRLALGLRDRYLRCTVLESASPSCAAPAHHPGHHPGHSPGHSL